MWLTENYIILNQTIGYKSEDANIKCISFRLQYFLRVHMLEGKRLNNRMVEGSGKVKLVLPRAPPSHAPPPAHTHIHCVPVSRHTEAYLLWKRTRFGISETKHWTIKVYHENIIYNTVCLKQFPPALIWHLLSRRSWQNSKWKVFLKKSSQTAPGHQGETG